MHPLLLALAAAPALAAQTLTIPAEAGSRDGTVVLHAAGFERPGRLQMIIGEQHLALARGGRLTALRLRRDGSLHDLRPGVVTVTVSASASATADPERPSPVFANNHSATPTVLHQGNVTLPAAPRLGSRDAATWQSPDSVTIQFSTPFAYPGGTLCLQIDMVPVVGGTTSWWPIDAEQRGSPGRIWTRGRACGAAAALADRPASADALTLRVGTTAQLTSLGPPSATAVSVVGATTVGPIDLAFLGAPGCELHVLPEVVLVLPVSQAIAPGRPGAASIGLLLPNEPQLLAARLHTQWLLVSPGLSVTNALDLELSPVAGSMGVSIVAAASSTPVLPAAGRVEASVLPVVQIDWVR